MIDASYYNGDVDDLEFPRISTTFVPFDREATNRKDDKNNPYNIMM